MSKLVVSDFSTKTQEYQQEAQIAKTLNASAKKNRPSFEIDDLALRYLDVVVANDLCRKLNDHYDETLYSLQHV